MFIQSINQSIKKPVRQNVHNQNWRAISQRHALQELGEDFTGGYHSTLLNLSMSCLNSTKDNEDCSYIESRNSEMSSKRSIIVGILQGVDARAVHIADTSQHHPGLPKSDSFVAPGDSNTSDLKLETGKKNRQGW